MKNYMENEDLRRKNMKITSPEVNYERAIEVNNELMLNFDEQQDKENI